MDVKIRPANTRDIDDIVRLWCELAQFHADLDPRFALREDADRSFRDFAAHLVEGAESTVLCAWVGGEMVGFVSMEIQIPPPVMRFSRFAMIYDQVVNARYRRSGIGGQLFTAARGWCKDRGMSIIQLSVAPWNPVAVGFWRKMGFRPYLDRLWYDIE
jgi:ribosomal protein S18 acetylase RimI-like enzyme